MQERTNPITPAGYAALRAEYDRLFAVERPAVVETVSWAAGNGDRSENGDYIYGKQKLRAIDRELGRLSKKMKAANVIDTIADEDDNQRTVTIIGDDEADAATGRIGWNSPLARTLRGARIGDVRTVQLPAGPKEWEVVAISYPD